MNCKQAQPLIDSRVQSETDPRRELQASPDWAELDAHLSGCASCSAIYRDLLQTQRAVLELKQEKPTEEETQSMWLAITQDAEQAGMMNESGSIASADESRLQRLFKRQTFRYALACTGVAAALFWALLVGQYQYATQSMAIYGQEFSSVTGERGSPVVSKKMQSRRGRSAVVGDYYDPDTKYSASSEPTAMGRGVVPSQPYEADGDDEDALAYAGVAIERVPSIDPSASGRPPGGKEMRCIRPPDMTASEMRDLIASLKGPERDEGYLGERFYEPTDHDSDGNQFGSWEAEESGDDGSIATELSEDGDSNQPVETLAVPQKSGPAAPQAKRSAKVIKTGALTLEVADYTEAVGQIETLVARIGGAITDEQTEERRGGSLSGIVIVRMAPELFTTVFDALKGVGRIEAENAGVTDVTAEYVDLEARIHSHKIAEERLHQLISDKSLFDKVASLLEVERELTRVRSQIEQYEGRLRVMADRVALSTITVHLHEPARQVPSATLLVEVPVLEEAISSIEAALESASGRVRSGNNTKHDSGSLRGEYEFEVSLAAFGEFVKAIEGVGRVDDRRVDDWRVADADAPWADRVKCSVRAVLFEPYREPPSGHLTLEVESVGDAVAVIKPIVAGLGASIVSNVTTRRDCGSSEAQLSIRIPAGRFGELVSQLEVTGRVTRKSVSGAVGQILGGAADVHSELSLIVKERDAQVASSTMSIEVGSISDTMAELVKLIERMGIHVVQSSSEQRPDGTWSAQFQLALKTSDIEAAIAELTAIGKVRRLYSSGLGMGELTAMPSDALGTLNVNIYETPAINPSAGSASGSIRSSLRDGLKVFYKTIALIIFGLIAIVPWLVLIVLLGWLIVRLLGRRRKSPKLPEKA